MGQLVDHETRIMSHAEDAECAEARIVSLACGLRGACFWPTDGTDKQMKQKTNSAVSTIRRLKNTIRIKTGAYLKRFDSAYSGIISTLSIAPKFSSEVRMPYSSFLPAMNWYILFIEPDVPAFTSIGTTLASLTMT